jgi:hypothetical protein
MRTAYKILVEPPKGNRRVGRPRRRWEDNSKLDPTETGWEDSDWMHLT